MTDRLTGRGRRVTAFWAVAILAVAGALVLLGRWSVPLNHRAGYAAPRVSPIVANPRVGQLNSLISLAAQAQYRRVVRVSAPTAVGAFRQVVTGAPLQDGAHVTLGALLGAVDAVPVFAMQGAVPSFRVLHVGDQGVDVAELTASLKHLGYLRRVRNTVTVAVVQAVARFLTDRGYPGLATGLAGAGIDSRIFTFVPTLPAVVISTDLIVGNELGRSGASLAIGEGEAQLVVAPDHNGAEAPVGAVASVTCGSRTVTGRVTSVTTAWQSATSTDSDAASSDTGVTQSEPTVGWIVDTHTDVADALGSSCVATATIRQGAAATVSVPQAALYTAGDGTSKLHVRTHGTAFTTLTVRAGSPADGWVPIIDPPASLTRDTMLIVGSD